MSFFGPTAQQLTTVGVRCTHHRYGCKWEGASGMLESHLQNCSFELFSHFLQEKNEEIRELRIQLHQLQRVVSSLQPERNKCFRVDLASHTSVVVSLAFYNKMLFSGSMDGTLKVWNLDTRQVSNEVPLGPVFSLKIRGDRLYSGHNQCIKVWNLNTFSLIATLTGHLGNVKALLAQGNRLFSGSNAEIKIWDLVSLQCIRTLTLEATTGEVRDFTATTDSNGSMLFLWSCSDDGYVKVWNSNFQCVNAIVAHKGPIRAMRFISSGLLATGSDDTYIKLWSIGSSISQVACLPCLVGVTSLALASSSLISGHADGAIRVWQLSEPNPASAPPVMVKLLSGHRDHVRALEVCTDLQCFASGSYDRGIAVWYPLR